MLRSSKQTSKLMLRAVRTFVLSHFRDKSHVQETYTTKAEINPETENATKAEISPETEKNVIDVMMKLGFTAGEIKNYPQLFKIHPQTLDHRGQVLKEGGFYHLLPFVIYRYRYFTNKKVSLLKAWGYIAPETNVADSFLHHLGNPPLDLLPLFFDDNKFIEIYNLIMMHYLQWRLETTESRLETIKKRYTRFKHKSLQYTVQTLDILENELGFSKEKILRNGYLIHSHPQNTLDTLERVPELGGMEIRQVLRQHPKIIMTNTNTLISTVNVLKRYGIPDGAMQRCPDIFTLSSDSVNRRLERLQAVPELRVLANHKSVLRLVHYQHKVCDRLSHLQDNQIRSASLHVLSCANSLFEKFAQEGEFRSRGNDTVSYLSQQLQCSKPKVRSGFHRHSFWSHVPAVNIERTLGMLLGKGFSKEDILENLHILLYPRDLVEKELDALDKREEIKLAQHLQHTINKVPLYLTELVCNQKKLALCLYFIERVHHFTGNGVWNSSL